MQTLIKQLPASFRQSYRSQWRKISLSYTIFLAKLFRQFYRPPYPICYPHEINLHLGCGRINHPDFVNVDGLPYPHIHYVRAIDNLSPFKDGSIDLIYACHCLEHFSHHQIPKILAHWFQKLKIGGTLRISVPDFNQLCQMYLENGQDIRLILSSTMGGQSDHLDFHKTIFNFESLQQLLIVAGFKEVREWQPDELSKYRFDDWSVHQYLINGKFYPVSLNLEAVK